MHIFCGIDTDPITHTLMPIRDGEWPLCLVTSCMDKYKRHICPHMHILCILHKNPNTKEHKTYWVLYQINTKYITIKITSGWNAKGWVNVVQDPHSGTINSFCATCCWERMVKDEGPWWQHTLIYIYIYIYIYTFEPKIVYDMRSQHSEGIQHDSCGWSVRRHLLSQDRNTTCWSTVKSWK